MNLSTTIQAGARIEYYEPGDFLRIMASVDPLDVTFYRDGREIARAVSVGDGYAEKFDAQSFDRFTVSSATTQAIQIVTRLGAVVSYDKAPTGEVVVSNTAGAFTQAQATVTNASGQLLAAKAARRYLLIQNKDASGDIYVNLTGAAATTANGIKIAAGGSYECQGYQPTAAITAIGSLASNANIVVVEG